MKKILIYLFNLILIIFFNHCKDIRSTYQKINNGVIFESQKINCKVQFYNDNIVRIVKWIPGSSPEKKSLIIVEDTLENVNFEVKNAGRYIILSSNKMSIKIAKIDGSIQYLDKYKNVILKEGDAEIIPDTVNKENVFNIKQKFHFTSDEGVYGLGQHQNGVMNYRGNEVKLVQTNIDAVNPFIISTKSYGILWDNYSKTIFKDKDSETSLWSEVADNIDYYFISGTSMDNVIKGYRELTGKAPMYGKYAYGYWQSKEHYEDRDELLHIVHEYRERNIPIDNIIQDWDYWDGFENWGQLYFSPNKFPNPKEMIEIIHRLNFHIMISIWPGLGPSTPIYKEMDKKGYLFPPVGWAGFKYFDAYIPDACNIYWKYMRDGLFSKGIDAWWIDSTEPDIINALTKESTEYEMKKLGKNYLGTWARYLNAYSLLMTKRIYENQRKFTDQKRVYILTRSSFAGQQRYATTTWSGDIGARWDVYKDQITAGLNFCMAGIPYWTFDIGAFVIGAYGGVFPNGRENPAYWELYTRMFQFGAFCPIFRSHGSETPREIWQFGGESSPFYKSMLKFDNLRYRLLPYIYSLAWDITNDGYTIMRGLAMDFNNDKQVYSVDDQYMFGPALMVCPVTEYMYHRPPENSILIEPEYFKDKNGKPGLHATYYKDKDFKEVTLKRKDKNINILWYSGRPDYVTDSAYSIRWEGKLIPKETGKHQFHTKCYDEINIYLDGKKLDYIYRSTERRTEFVNLEANKEYDFLVEVSNNQTGAAKAKLYWKTPGLFESEKRKIEREKIRNVYLPKNKGWYDFWTGEMLESGKNVSAGSPIDKIPLYVKAGSIVPMGPFVQYATEKPADPIELRIYPGTNTTFTLYEDENDNYNYEKGMYATIDFIWNEKAKKLIIDKHKGSFPGMLQKRKFNIIMVRKDHGIDIGITEKPDKIVEYKGERLEIQF